MKSKQYRIFNVNGKEMIFNVKIFCSLFREYAKKNNMGIGMYEYEVAKQLCIDSTSVHNWRFEINGPSDIEKIKLLAKYWNVNYEVLLKENKKMNTDIQKSGLSDREKEALKNVYISFMKYLNIYKNTAGFIWNEDGTDFDIRQAYALYDQVVNALEVEYIDLKGNVYDELRMFYDKELTYTLEGYYCEDEGDSPELQQAESESLREFLLTNFKERISSFLVG